MSWATKVGDLVTTGFVTIGVIYFSTWSFALSKPLEPNPLAQI